MFLSALTERETMTNPTHEVPKMSDPRVHPDPIKNGSTGRTSPDSCYFRVSGSKPGSAYGVTINYLTGHWCECRGNLSKRGAFSRRGERQSTSIAAHWCRHVKAVLANPVLIEDSMTDRLEQIKAAADDILPNA